MSGCNYSLILNLKIKKKKTPHKRDVYIIMSGMKQKFKFKFQRYSVKVMKLWGITKYPIT